MPGTRGVVRVPMGALEGVAGGICESFANMVWRSTSPTAHFNPEDTMSRTIYVGNLPFSTDEPELQALFETIGGVQSTRIALDRETQRPRGFGFVVMRNDADHERAIERFNGHQHRGRTLVVNEARPREAPVRR